MNIFVTGITGHSGSYFVERLKKEKSDFVITCVVRDTSDTAMLDESNLNIKKVTGDLNDIAFLSDAMKNSDIILHIASIYQSQNVIKAAKKANIKNVILVHTTGMFSKFKSASSEYIEIEKEVLNNRKKVNITILRPTMIYGSVKDRNMYKLVEYLNTHKFFPIFGSGKNLMQPVHAKDLGDVYYDVLKNWDITKNKEYNLAGKYPIEYIELVHTIEDYLGKKVYNIKVPIWISLIGAYCYNLISKSALISIEQVQRMMEDKIFSYEDAENDFNYSPMSFSDGIKGEAIEYLKQKGAT